MTPDEKREAVREIKKRIRSGQSHDAQEAREAWAALRGVAAPDDDFALQHQYAKLLEKLAPDALGLVPLRLALLSTSTVDHLAAVFRFWLATMGFALELFTSDYGTLEQTVLDPDSGLYRFKPSVVWLFTSGRDVALHADPSGDAEGRVADAVGAARSLWAILAERLTARVIQNNADLDAARPFGNFEGSVPWSRTNLLRAYNLALARAAGSGVTIFDLDFIAGDIGRRAWHDAGRYHDSKHAFSLEALGVVAHAAAALVASVKGKAKKCLVLDLDNTLWGGVIGDDGLAGIRLGQGDGTGEAHLAFQRYVRQLKERGVILAVASKNEDAAARAPFLEHPEMALRLDDIAAFRANWTDKAENLRSIAAALDIGLDALVFVDDNPVERDLVRRTLPMVEVPEMGDDPSRYCEILDRGRYFETVTFSAEDRLRADAYRQNALRADAATGFTDVHGFLESLEMRGIVGEVSDLQLPRFVQLLNKSNQFHLTTTRYDEAQVRAFMADPARVCFFVRLEDRFGDNGLIAALVLDLPRSAADPLVIDTWAMSCRVLSRGVEELILAEVQAYAARTGSAIVGRYIRTAKNALVAGLYERLGFTRREDAEASDDTTVWELAPGARREPTHHIERVSASGAGGPA